MTAELCLTCVLTRIHARSANVVSSAEWHRWAAGSVAGGPIGARCRTFGIVCKHLPHLAQEFLRGGEHCTGLYSTVRYCMVLLYSAVQYGEVLHGIVVSTLPEAPPRPPTHPRGGAEMKNASTTFTM